MKYTIKDGWLTITGKAPGRPFVARVPGLSDKFGLEREFVSTSELAPSDKVPAGMYRARFAINETRFVELGGWAREGMDKSARVYGEIKGGAFVPCTLEHVKQAFAPVGVDELEYDEGLPF